MLTRVTASPVGVYVRAIGPWGPKGHSADETKCKGASVDTWVYVAPLNQLAQGYAL